MIGIGTAIPFNQNVGNLVAPLNPTQMSKTCGLWYDFTDLSSLVISSDKISRVANKGTISNADLDNRDLTLAPTSKFEIDHYTARFDLATAQQLLSINAIALNNNGVFVIVSRLIDEGTQSVYGMATMRSPNVVSMRFINNGANTTISQFTSGSTATDSQATSPLATNLNYSMYDISDDTDDLTAYYNGTAGASVTMSGTPVTTAGQFIIGSSNTSAQYFNGDIYEVFYFTSNLNSKLKGEIEAYIETKYAIPQS